MLIHLGGGVSVPKEAVVLMADVENGYTLDTSRLKDRLEQAARLRRIGKRPSTLVICQEQGQEAGYLTAVGLRTLKKRWQETEFMAKEVLV